MILFPIILGLHRKSLFIFVMEILVCKLTYVHFDYVHVQHVPWL